ncbi:hypothetical protein NYE69_09530 [Paenibacillus sp. FSL R5-0527]|uniref:hypothetical protein n=1 Tax=Paenibacillus TaxID=44249 RepID=UPI00097B7531|nr:hypothetical protein [Paenibacillus macerans]OMG47062.1 hypothetical protein BK140_23445 [Paenibacillus macerans]
MHTVRGRRLWSGGHVRGHVWGHIRDYVRDHIRDYVRDHVRGLICGLIHGLIRGPILAAALLLVSGCAGSEARSGNGLDSEPPLPVVRTAADTAITVIQGSYCWSGTGKSGKTGQGVCVDYASPSEMAQGKPAAAASPGEKITFRFDNVKPPTETTVTLFKDGRSEQVAAADGSFEVPHEPGTYVYDLFAIWLKDPEKRISEGTSSYVFSVRVE